VKTREICAAETFHYGGKGQRKIYELVEISEGGKKSVFNYARSVRPSALTCLDVKVQIYQRMRDNRKPVLMTSDMK
jgi:hypothetical protein